MAGHTSKALPMIDLGWPGLKLDRLFVAIAARNCHVSSSQDKASFFVPGQTERGRLIAVEVMTSIAGIKVWSSGKLGAMLVGVAIRAVLKLDLE